MPVIARKLNLVYYDVPKIACTSLKTLFFELETGTPLDSRPPSPSLLRRALTHLRLAPPPRPWKRTRIHGMEGYRTQSWLVATPPPDGLDTLVVLRDPASRLHSAWSNKVCERSFAIRGELEDLTNEGLPHDPDFGTFLELFDQYRQVSRPARWHTHPYAWHLGPDSEAFDHVFRMEEFDRVIDFLSDRAGRPLSAPRRNVAEEETRSQTLTSAQLDRLAEITAADYAWLKGLYDPDEGLARFR